MPNQFGHSRPIVTHSEHDFGVLLGKVLSPSQPLQSEEYLRGRTNQLTGIKQALHSPGRHVLIHGFRGVGKSSLAQTAAYAISRGGDPIIVACDSKSTFASVIYDIVNEASNKHPFVAKKLKETRVGVSAFVFNADYKETNQDAASPGPPSSVNEAVRYIQAICDVNHFKPVIVIDEFDQLKDKDEQTYFTNFIKQISDKHVSAKFVFLGLEIASRQLCPRTRTLIVISIQSRLVNFHGKHGLRL